MTSNGAMGSTDRSSAAAAADEELPLSSRPSDRHGESDGLLQSYRSDDVAVTLPAVPGTGDASPVRLTYSHLLMFVDTQYHGTSIVMLVPAILLSISLVYEVTGQLWPAIPCVLHALIALLSQWRSITGRSLFSCSCRRRKRDRLHQGDSSDSRNGDSEPVGYSAIDVSPDEDSYVDGGDGTDHSRTNGNHGNIPGSHRVPYRGTRVGLMLTCSVIDALLIETLYTQVFRILAHKSFIDVDGTIIAEWKKELKICRTIQYMLHLVVLSRVTTIVLVLLFGAGALFGVGKHPWISATRRFAGRLILRVSDHRWSLLKLPRLFLWAAELSVVFALLVLAVVGCVQIFGSINDQVIPTNYMFCDPLDPTECALPFPSFHHMKRDLDTVTGWRVDLRSHTLPPMRDGRRMSLDFLNEQLDGFSTMAPIIFYVDGMKEAYEHLHGTHVRGLKGKDDIADSVTYKSWTLLLNVNTSTLVPHISEIDDGDTEHPLVMVTPAQPLDHHTHYAVALVNAVDQHNIRLPPTLGMMRLMQNGIDESLDEGDRLSRYRDVVIPTLHRAAPWVDADRDPQSLQLLFDFVTASREAQLGPLSAARDMTMRIIEEDWGGDWTGRVRVVRQENYNCDRTVRHKGVPHEPLIARLVHGEIDAPWFLTGEPNGRRNAVMDINSMQSTRTNKKVGRFKFILQVPCSVKYAILDDEEGSAADSTDSKHASGVPAIQAVIDYGHGLFYNRNEATERSIRLMASDEQYIVVSMDWRGMSAFDLPVISRAMLSNPASFQATRDNLFQGYIAKLALQHFIRHGLAQTTNFLAFTDSDGQDAIPDDDDVPHSVEQTTSDHNTVSVFYGNSQGAMLGAGYSSWLSSTRLLDRVVLGAAGISFSYTTSRSRDFQLFHKMLLLCTFQNHRQARIFLSVQQMAWDPAEGAGWRANSPDNAIPVLLQAGLGDPVVTTFTAEALARSYNAGTIPNNPRKGIPGIGTMTNSTRAVLTEVLHVTEYAHLYNGDKSYPFNDVHLCLRQNCQLMKQIVRFVNEGVYIDLDGLIVRQISCYDPGRRNNTRLSNWTCDELP